MTDKPVMTKGELEKLGYIVTNQHQVISPDGWEFMTGGDALQAATQHYRQQQELARLRVLEEVASDAIVDLHILASRIRHTAVAGDIVSVLNVLLAAMNSQPEASTVSEGEAK